MAVYKPTYCYPFADSFDARVTWTKENYNSGSNPVKCLTCKVETSNKDVTGYAIRLLDSSGKQIFPLDDGEKIISPIEEIQIPELGYDKNGTNSGRNGTYLKIPFFQNVFYPLIKSYNALYYNGARWRVDRIIASNGQGFSASDNWAYDGRFPDHNYRYLGDSGNISVDGEKAQNGDIVALSKGDSSGMYRVQKEAIGDIGGENYEENIFLDFISLDRSGRVLVSRGKTCREKIYDMDYTEYSDNFWEQYVEGSLTPASENLPKVLGDAYSWEITLYQGTHSVVSSNQPWSTTYNDEENDSWSNNWADMKMASGKILGTTPDRLQLSDTGKEYLPSAGANNTLVLQNTWACLGNQEDTIFSSQRVAVKNYDASLGHAYPETSGAIKLDVDSNNYCQFFKYSNNEADIKEQDIVQYAAGENIEFKYNYTTTYLDQVAWALGTDSSSEGSLDPADSVLNKYIIVNPTDFAGVADGTQVLLTGQTSLKQNGVYVYSKMSLPVNGIETLVKVDKWVLTRSASYSSWGNFIGKIFYIKSSDGNGVAVAGTNVIAGIIPGNFALWNIRSVDSGDSPLPFVQESPLVLFRDMIAQNVDGCITTFGGVEGQQHILLSVFAAEGVPPQIGREYLYIPQGRNIRCICRITEKNDVYCAYEIIRDVQDGEIFYVLTGKKFAQRAVSVQGYQVQTSFAPTTALLLKNSKNETYISPYINIEKNMYIKLLHNKEVSRLDSGNIFINSRWLKINDINKVFYCIKHRELSAPLVSYDEKDKGIPYEYNVMSHFIPSDQNVFYDNADPYITLFKRGEEWSDLQPVNVYNATTSPTAYPGWDSTQYFIPGIYGYTAQIPVGISASGLVSQNPPLSNYDIDVDLYFRTSNNLLKQHGKRCLLIGNFQENTSTTWSISLELRPWNDRPSDDHGENDYALLLWTQYGAVDESQTPLKLYHYPNAAQFFAIEPDTEYHVTMKMSHTYSNDVSGFTWDWNISIESGYYSDSETECSDFQSYGDTKTFEGSVQWNELSTVNYDKDLCIFGDWRQGDFEPSFSQQQSVVMRRIVDNKKQTPSDERRNLLPYISQDGLEVGLTEIYKD